MPDSVAALPHTIRDLLDKRHSHVQAVAEIDATLARVNAALGSTQTPRTKVILPAPKVAAPKAGSRKNARVPVQTANEFVLAFVRAKKDPTSHEINTAWKSAGRIRTADITLSLLTKAKKLKRTPLGAGIRGSRYTMAA